MTPPAPGPTRPETHAESLADAVLLALPEPALITTTDGQIITTNAAAAALIGLTPAELRCTRLTDHVTDAPTEVARYLDACARTRSPLPGALHLLPHHSVDSPRRSSVVGAVVQPAAPGALALVLLRFRAGEGASTRFVLLNRQLDELTREVRARRAAEAALVDANARLQDQALELELANQQLQDQALELEQQIEAARELAEELAGANERLAAEASAADAARQVAETANSAKNQFLSTMSHELRTPLNAISGFTQLLTMELRGPLTGLQRQDLARIDRASQHLMALVTDVLNFARLGSGQLEFHLADVELADVVGDLEPLLGPQFVAKGLTFDHDGCAADTPARPHRVHADPEKLRQILLNLLSNAVKFTDSGGRVSLACETDRAAGVVRVHVSDTGRGIPADQLERIFEPFVQVDRHRTHESQQGVGLGLAISRDLARRMGGDLTVVSAPGAGSTFILTLRTPESLVGSIGQTNSTSAPQA